MKLQASSMEDVTIVINKATSSKGILKCFITHIMGNQRGSIQYCTAGQNQKVSPLTPLYVSHILALAQFQIDREAKAKVGALTLVDQLFHDKESISPF
jgi:hypothetical protein